MQDVITDFDEQIIAPLVKMNFGIQDNYEIECFGLLRGGQDEVQEGFQNAQNQEGATEDGQAKPQGFAQSIVIPGNRVLGLTQASLHFGENLMYYAGTGSRSH